MKITDEFQEAEVTEARRTLDMVNSPAHYNAYSLEVIDAIQGTSTEDEFRGYLKGNIMKYVLRYRFKNLVEDLKKAEWYLNRLKEFEESRSNIAR